MWLNSDERNLERRKAPRFAKYQWSPRFLRPQLRRNPGNEDGSRDATIVIAARRARVWNVAARVHVFSL